MTREQAAIKVDRDEPEPLSLRDITRLLWVAGYKPVAVCVDRSPGGFGWHYIVHVTPRPSSPYEVVALALILGSDVRREAMQMHRAKAFPKVPTFMRNAWNVLYAPHPQRQRHMKGVL